MPVSYGEGTSRIRGTALTVLRVPRAVNNVSAGVVERLLVARYPHRKTLIRALSWVERIAFASLLTYTNSADHIRQASTNRRLAREYGYTAVAAQHALVTCGEISPRLRNSSRVRSCARHAHSRFGAIWTNRPWYDTCHIAGQRCYATLCGREFL